MWVTWYTPLLVKTDPFSSFKGLQRSHYLWKFGNYCDESLHTLQDATSTLQPDFDAIEYTKIVIKCYFESINRGYRDATNFYPRLLELIELYPETGPMFNQHVRCTILIWKISPWHLSCFALVSWSWCCLEVYQVDSSVGLTNVYVHCRIHFSNFGKNSSKLSQSPVLPFSNVLRVLRIKKG
jgi:hypothetical protein